MELAQKHYKNEYWLNESPLEVKTERLWLTYFSQAGKLQVAQIYQKDGEDKRGKTITLDISDLAQHPEATALIMQALGLMQ
jgi:adenylylsulfate kinase-like enzyme